MNLIEALRLTASRIEDGTYQFCWYEFASCSCGLLVQTLLGVSAVELEDTVGSIGFIWSDAGAIWRSTGHPMKLLINQLIAAGLTAEHISDLEYCRNKSVCSRVHYVPKSVAYHRSSVYVVEYMRAWADILEEQAQEAEVTVE